MFGTVANTERLTLDIRGRHRHQSSPLLRFDDDPSDTASFRSILGSACSGRTATVLEFPPTSEIFALKASFSVLEIRKSLGVRLGV